MTINEDFDIPESGAIFTFGKSRFAENTPSKFWIKNDVICDIACGDEHTAILTGSGRLFMIGNNSNGQLGLQHKKNISRPSCIKALKPERISKVACGRAHTIASSDSGTIYAWGQNDDGQLGTADTVSHDSPVVTLNLSAEPKQLSAGSSHSMLLSANYQVWVWGSNKDGQLGTEDDRKLIPFKLNIGCKISSIACGYHHSVALSDGGQVLCWGENQDGQLGIGTKPPTNSRIHRLKLKDKIAMVAAGGSHSIVLTESGKILTCGVGKNGQLGQGSKIYKQTTFEPVIGGEENTFLSIYCGEKHAAAISELGHVFTWGCGRHGKLCLGEHNFTNQYAPVFVNRLRHLAALQVSCGGCHTMVLGYRRVAESDTNSPQRPKTAKGSRKACSPRRLFRRTIQPTASDDGRKTVEVIDQEKPEVGKLQESSPVPSSFRSKQSTCETNTEEEERSSRSKKKVGRFARFLGSLRKTMRGSDRETKVPNGDSEYPNVNDQPDSAEPRDSNGKEVPEEEEKSSKFGSPASTFLVNSVEDNISKEEIADKTRSRTCVIL